MQHTFTLLKAVFMQLLKAYLVNQQSWQKQHLLRAFKPLPLVRFQLK